MAEKYLNQAFEAFTTKTSDSQYINSVIIVFAKAFDELNGKIDALKQKTDEIEAEIADLLIK